MNVVVDTNVAVTANALEEPDPECVRRCLRELKDVQQGKNCLALDKASHIVKEYISNLNLRGEPKAGTLFLYWVFNNMKNPKRCVLVPITPDNQREFLEFPNDPHLANFDRSDRKFVAVALTVGGGAEILNATDSDWQNAATDLARNGVHVRQLCPGC